MDNLNSLLNLIFGQRINPIMLQGTNGQGTNQALAGLTPQDFAPGQDLTGVLSPSYWSQAAVPSLIGGSLASMFPGTVPKAIGGGLSALGLLSALTG